MVKSVFQHCYRMWTWFVDFLDEKKAKINFKKLNISLTLQCKG